jgi:hypothetical protein
MILPGVVQEIAEVIGHEAALYLVGQLPQVERSDKSGDGSTGKRCKRRVTSLCVPKRLKLDHRLVGILGIDKAQALIEAFGGENFILPNCREVYTRFRNSEIQRMHREGMRRADIADIIGVSLSTVPKLTFANDD